MNTYACSDLHGYKSIYDKINQFIQPDDQIFFLGDAADRGPHGWEIIKDLVCNKNWIWIKGNHDEMLAHRIIGNEYGVAHLHEMNGGHKTWYAVQKDILDGVLTEEAVENIAMFMDNRLHLSFTWTNKDGKKIYMSHSGYYGKDSQNLVWDREHYFYPFEGNEDCDIIIHGHTPIPYVLEDIDPVGKLMPNYKENTALWYQDNTKCDIDNLTCVSGKAILLNLDTFEETIFEVDDKEKEALIA